MANTESGAPFQRIEELQQENEVLRDRVERAEGEIEPPPAGERAASQGVESGRAGIEAREAKT
jgi:hypothetical protein